MVVLYYFNWEDWKRQPYDMHVFASEADAQEFLLAMWEEDEYHAFLWALHDEDYDYSIEEILEEYMYDYCEESMDCWVIQRVEHAFI